MKSDRTTNNQLTRRDFLGRAGRGAGLAGMALAGGLYVPSAYAKERKEAAGTPDSQTPQNQPYVIPAYLVINPAEFPSTANLYPGASSPGAQYSNPRLANKTELLKVTPSYREVDRGKYGPARSDIILAQGVKEFFNELFSYCNANGIGFVGDLDAYKQIITGKPEWAGTPESKRNEDLTQFLTLYDLTPILSEILRNKKYEEPASMGDQLSEEKSKNFWK
jgi:hypothetical protein